MRLVLFDIDGTLLSASGAGRRCMSAAMEEIFGTSGPVASHPFGGKTDPQICQELLALAGFDATAIAAGWPGVLRGYLDRLALELQDPAMVQLMPGVVPLLAALAAEPQVVLGLLTGNVREGAALKLGVHGLDPYFAFGAYGCDDADRNALPAIARARAHQHTGHWFEGGDIVIVGDTPADVQCGRGIGARALAVATGPYPLTELLLHEPAHAFPTLEDMEAVLSALRS